MRLSKPELVAILDIEPPFLMIDAALEVVPLQSAHAIKCIDAEEWFMQCHLKSSPVMPGTLQTEAMLQAFVLPIYMAGIVVDRHIFVRNFDAIFFRKVQPSDAGGVLHVETSIGSNRHGVLKGCASLTLNEELISKADITMVSPASMPVPVR